MPDLSNQTIVVTGAGRGWGHSISRKLASYGALVIATSEVEPELQDLADTVRGEGGQIEIQVVDLTDRAALDAFTAGVITHHSHIDTLPSGT